MRNIEVKIRQIYWVLVQLFRPTTYDLVNFQGETFFVKSSMTGDNIWDLYKKAEKTPTYKYVNGDDLKIIHSLKRFINNYKWHMKFQTSYWGSIDKANPIGTRLSYYNSSNIRFQRDYN